MLSIGDRVKLLQFNGETNPPEDCLPEENYWLLIGELGTIAEPETCFDRILVKFDLSVSAKGLYCHNEIPNTLFILKSDLVVL